MEHTAIVIGATGLVGQALTHQLVQADHVDRIITLTRRPAPHASAKVENQVVDFDHLEDHAPLFQGELLFSCLGTTRKQAGSIAAQRRVDLDYQYAAAQLAAANGVSHYLLVSSSMANADHRNPYLQMKGELERRVAQLPFQRISIFQPSVLLGSRPEVRPGEKLAGWILPALCTLPGLRRYRPIRGSQVAAKMIQASQNPGTGLERFVLDQVFPDSA